MQSIGGPNGGRKAVGEVGDTGKLWISGNCGYREIWYVGNFGPMLRLAYAERLGARWKGQMKHDRWTMGTR